MIPKTPAFLIDCDGTLCDTLPLWQNLAVNDLRARGIEPDPNLNEVIATWTMRQVAAYLIKRHQLPLAEEALMDDWQRQVDDGYRLDASVGAKAGALGALHLLQSFHMPAYAVTLSPRSLVEPLLRRTGLLSMLQGVYSGHEWHLGKEDPRLFFMVAEALEREPSRCIVVEDSLFALRTAAASGFHTVAFFDPYHDQAHWKAMVAEADLAITHWYQFTHHIASRQNDPL